MKLKLKKFEVSAGRPIAFLNIEDAKKIDVNVGDRAQVIFKKKKIICTIDLVKDFEERGHISLSKDVVEYLGIKVGESLDLDLVARPESSKFIAKKMNGKVLSKQEIYQIIQDIVNNALTEPEIAQFVVGVYRAGMNFKETVYLTDAMCRTGTMLKWKSKIIADKHCIGGIPGNRTTPIVVPICAAAGVIMPKTSSRAITSAAGTADTVETVTKVDFSSEDLSRIVNKVGACLAWGGSLGLAPADDKLIKIERILKIDPEGQLIASILSKKLSVGSTHAVIDIPYGEGAKVSLAKAKDLSKKFIQIAKAFKLKLKVILTDGSQPIGNGVGPALEMIDVIKVLKRDNPPKDLEKKCLMLAGEILELVGKAKKGKGREMALEILESGKAYRKFEEIVEAQGKNIGGLKLGSHVFTKKAERAGKIRKMNNKGINEIALILGCPTDKGTGLYLHRHVGDKVAKGDDIATFYAESKERLDEAIEAFDKNRYVEY